MCPLGQWEKVTKGSWVRSMSPFDNRILDIRTAGSSLENFVVSIEEGTFLVYILMDFPPIIFLTLVTGSTTVILFCRIFLISRNMFNPGHSFDERRVLSKQVISVLLWKCNLNRSHPCNIDDTFSGNIVFISFTINNWIPFTIFKLQV